MSQTTRRDTWRVTGPATEVAATVAALGAYVGTVLPQVRAEQRYWAARATSIPDPVLRGQAVDALRRKARNVEGTAVFGILAPRPARSRVVGAGVALQIAIDYLDSLGEAKVDDPLADGLRLHRALLGVVEPGAERDDPYRLHPQGDDGGYLGELIRGAATIASTLARWDACAPFLGIAIARCGEGQAHTHAAGDDGGVLLRRWAEGLNAPPGFAWWEVAAGASSSVAAHALLALAADPEAGAEAPELVDAAYFPSIGALTVLLDDLVDLDEDVASGEHNYIACYGDDQELAERLGTLADRAAAATALLPRRRRHRAILAGVAGFYLGDPAVAGRRGGPARDRLLRSLGAPTRILASFSRLQSHV